MKASATVWSGRVLTGLFALFILGASVLPKLSGMPIAEQSMAELGWPSGYVLMFGLMELTFLILYLIPRTSLLGAVLFTGLLDGWRRAGSRPDGAAIRRDPARRGSHRRRNGRGDQMGPPRLSVERSRPADPGRARTGAARLLARAAPAWT